MTTSAELTAFNYIDLLNETELRHLPSVITDLYKSAGIHGDEHLDKVSDALTRFNEYDMYFRPVYIRFVLYKIVLLTLRETDDPELVFCMVVNFSDFLLQKLRNGNCSKNTLELIKRDGLNDWVWYRTDDDYEDEGGFVPMCNELVYEVMDAVDDFVVGNAVGDEKCVPENIEVEYYNEHFFQDGGKYFNHCSLELLENW